MDAGRGPRREDAADRSPRAPAHDRRVRRAPPRVRELNAQARSYASPGGPRAHRRRTFGSPTRGIAPIARQRWGLRAPTRPSRRGRPQDGSRLSPGPGPSARCCQPIDPLGAGSSRARALASWQAGQGPLLAEEHASPPRAKCSARRTNRLAPLPTVSAPPADALPP